MNMDQLKYLITISQNKSMSAASEQLHMTSQALSIAIKKLEDELGFSLLNRSFKGVSLTEDGNWLVETATVFLEKIEEHKLQHVLEEQYLRTGELELLVNYSGMGNTLLGQLICLLYQKEPKLQIQLLEISKEEILDLILTRKNELGFVFQTKLNGTYVEELDDDLIFEPLFDGEMLVQTSKKLDLAKFESTTIKKAMHYPVCTYLPRNCIDNAANLFTQTFRMDIENIMDTNFSVFQAKVLQGIGITLSVKFSVEDLPLNYIEGTKLLRVRDDLRIYFGIVKRKDGQLSENANYFLKELKLFIERLEQHG